jgi:pimeloyl-ACP methyl ester carboxylesterase
VASAAGSGSAPGDRAQWPTVAATVAAGFLERGMAAMADEIGRAPTRVQLQRKSPRSWQEFMDHLNEHSPLGMANTMSRYQALRPSLYDFREQFAAMTTPLLLALGDEDAPCLETNLMLKQTIPGSALWIHPRTGHAINLEEPAAFNAMVESFFAGVERSAWSGNTGAR